MYQPSFLQQLAGLETLILGKEGTWRSLHARRTLLDLISFVENASFTHSDHTKFICSNFRLSPSELQERWNNREGIDMPKSEEAFRSQISTVSKCLYQIFSSDVFNYFISDNEAGLSKIDLLLDTLTIYQSNIHDYYCSEILDSVKDQLWSRTYETAELLPEIEALSPYLKSEIWDVLDELNEEKVSYLFHVLKQPLTFNKRRETNMQKLEILQELSKKPVKQDLFMERLKHIAVHTNDYPQQTDNVKRVERLLKVYYQFQSLQ